MGNPVLIALGALNTSIRLCRRSADNHHLPWTRDAIFGGFIRLTSLKKLITRALYGKNHWNA
ncbi:uncharacterized protein PHALS_15067 [Plasmopara halstedii]|uniref:Uncharacterized protein n=1 Tax=Plasmopara halstedii TaxID=4781 RepID=A0A0P1AAS4_PLAHL|nr:uncharacterized protein PHALS_15067 [Plasmopara halstedii]CEG37366.1 hypothetical protein PHALS_15067 [Plasmopara halstedii]|eukprot:XP_024573735.1 hypothetical protein PHALS_15067 [Plasmopara halstedii]